MVEFVTERPWRLLHLGNALVLCYEEVLMMGQVLVSLTAPISFNLIGVKLARFRFSHLRQVSSPMFCQIAQLNGAEFYNLCIICPLQFVFPIISSLLSVGVCVHTLLPGRAWADTGTDAGRISNSVSNVKDILISIAVGCSVMAHISFQICKHG